MPPLPRGVCSVCGKSVALRRNGVTREHELEKAPSPHLTLGLCPGSGEPPAEWCSVHDRRMRGVLASGKWACDQVYDIAQPAPVGYCLLSEPSDNTH